MLDTFRTNAGSWIIQTLIAAISLVFIFSFGPGSRGCNSDAGPAGWAAKVNGEEVPASAFDQSLRRAIYFKQMMRRGAYTKDQARADKVREEAMNEVVDRELVAQAALEAGLWVSDADVAKEIIESEQFKKNGKFDEETYRRYVNNVEGLGPKRYEERVRRDLLVQRMYELTFGSIAVSEDEAKAEYLKAEEAASIEYVRFVAAQFRAQAEATDADTDKHLAEHLADVEKKYAVTKAIYMEPRAIKVRRVFEPVKADATQAEQDAAKAKVEQAKKDLDAGKGWAEVAAPFTADKASQDEAGSIGFVSLGRSRYGKQFEEAVFKLKVGERSGVVRDPFGYSVIEAMEERAAAEKKFDDVKREIAKDLARDAKARELAKAAATEALSKLKAGEALSAQFPKEESGDQNNPVAALAALAKKPQAQTTDEFHPYGGIIPGAGSAPKVSAAARRGHRGRRLVLGGAAQDPPPRGHGQLRDAADLDPRAPGRPEARGPPQEVGRGPAQGRRHHPERGAPLLRRAPLRPQQRRLAGSRERRRPAPRGGPAVVASAPSAASASGMAGAHQPLGRRQP
jgi:peptidyl-prolyl cis-trans isomerase D